MNSLSDQSVVVGEVAGHAIAYYTGRVMFLLGGFALGASIAGQWFAERLQQAGQTTPTDWLTGLGGLGVGGVIAAIVITWKRQDDVAHAKALADIGAERAKQLTEIEASNAKQQEAMFTRLETISARVLTAFEQNTRTVEQLALNSGHDQTNRKTEHERMQRELEELNRRLDDQARMQVAGIAEDRRRNERPSD